MAYRDDRAALLARIEMLEPIAARAEQLEAEVESLREEIQSLRLIVSTFQAELGPLARPPRVPGAEPGAIVLRIFEPTGVLRQLCSADERIEVDRAVIEKYGSRHYRLLGDSSVFRNGEAIETPVLLENGDRVRTGDTVFIVGLVW